MTCSATIAGRAGERSPTPAGWIANIATISSRELRESVGSRWFLLYTAAFAALGLGVSYISAASAGGLGLSGFWAHDGGTGQPGAAGRAAHVAHGGRGEHRLRS